MRLSRTLLALMLLVPTSRAAATTYSDIVVFGDSLSDVGNTDSNFFSQIADFFGAGTFDAVTNGRFSNGPVWVEPLSAKLGLPGSASTRSDIGGDNYAHGGALTGPGRQFLNVIDNLGRQVSDYTNSNNPTGDELFIVWGGGNNLLDGRDSPTVVATDMTDHVTALANDGAQHFLVLNLPLLGDIPRNRGTANQTTLNSTVTVYNDQLDTNMADLESALGIDITLFDVETTFARLLAEPAAFGFTNTTDPAFDNPAATDPETYVFWDDIHPTAAAHAVLADAAFVALQTPGDFTGDGLVDQADLQRVLTHFGQPTTPFNLDAGDWDGDGQAGISELDLVLTNWSGITAAPPVPEPGTLPVLACLAWLVRPRRRAGL